MMRRRTFVGLTGMGALASIIPAGGHFVSKYKNAPSGSTLTAGDVHRYLRSLCEVREPSVDTIILGDPDTKVKKIGTAWMGYWETCMNAVKAGVNVLIVHEPPFYNRDIHYFEQENIVPGHARIEYLDLVTRKRQWMEKNRLVIIRSHDVMDIVPKIGMPYALGHAIGLTGDDLIHNVPGYNVYKIGPEPAFGIARKMAKALKSAGQPGVGFCGDENRLVRSIGIGAGCNCDPIQFSWLEPDLFVAVDDKVRNWIQTTFAIDSGKPLVVINHGTSEEYGMRLLSEHLSETFRNYDVIHFHTGFTYRWIPA